MISNEILINYIKYKSQACNQTLYRAVFLYSKKEVKKLSYAFNKLKRKPKTPSKTQKIKQFFLPQTQTNGQKRARPAGRTNRRYSHPVSCLYI